MFRNTHLSQCCQFHIVSQHQSKQSRSHGCVCVCKRSSVFMHLYIWWRVVCIYIWICDNYLVDVSLIFMSIFQNFHLFSLAATQNEQDVLLDVFSTEEIKDSVHHRHPECTATSSEKKSNDRQKHKRCWL